MTKVFGLSTCTYIWKLNKDLNIQMCKMQVNMHPMSMSHHERWVNLCLLGLEILYLNSADEMDMILCSKMYMLLSK